MGPKMAFFMFFAWNWLFENHIAAIYPLFLSPLLSYASIWDLDWILNITHFKKIKF